MIKREPALSYENQGAQGDIYFLRVNEVPSDYTAVEPRDYHGTRAHILAHSESGHDHVIDASGVIMYEGPNPLVAYLRLADTDHVDVHHQKPHDFHLTDRLIGGTGTVWAVGRQREYDPAGERRAAD